MFRYVLLSLQLHIIFARLPWQTDTGKPSDVVSTLLRGSQATNSSDSASKLYTKECVDCAYTGEKCGCAPAMEYLACLTTHCYPADQSNFVKMCAALQSHCYSELDIACSGRSTVCKGKFHQLSSGGLGLTWDPTAAFDNAFCGPFGQCIGEIHMTVNIHNVPTKAVFEKPPAAKKDVVVPAPCDLDKVKDTKDKVKNTKELSPWHKVPMFLECGLPKTANAVIDEKEDWTICTSEVTGDLAECDLPMTAKLEAQQSLESYCVLTEGKGGARLTQPVWRNVANTVKKSRVYTDARHVQQPDSQHEQEVITMPYPYTKKKDTQTVPKDTFEVDIDVDSEDVVHAGEKAVDDIDRAADSADGKPAYMKYSDAEKKPPAPGSQIIQDIKNLQPADQAAEAVKTAKKTTRESSQRVSSEIKTTAAEAQQPIVESTEELEKGADASRAKAAEVAEESGEVVEESHQEGGEVVEEVRQQRPPWMRTSDAQKKAPFPVVTEERDDNPMAGKEGRVIVTEKTGLPVVEAVRMLNSVVPQSPIMMKLA